MPSGTDLGAVVSEARGDHRACAPDNLQRILLDVSHATASHRDLQSLLDELAGLLRRVARFDRLAIVLHDPEPAARRLPPIASLEPTNLTPPDLPAPAPPPAPGGQTQRPSSGPRTAEEPAFTEATRTPT